ncbi:MAG: SOS response-associated peptidase [Planctomycetes bacterium]|nr:SOS response-associated peptidase [Planctomycetota bacterium]MBI3845147.1 SOS response-associated peptidase [Planctomycetota bacterium]
MCARFTLMMPSWQDVWKLLQFEYREEDAAAYRPRYNIAPTSQHWVLFRANDKRMMTRAKWGLIPRWSKDAKLASRMINARLETVAEKPAYRSAFKDRRCIVPADGFYEWTGPEGDRQPLWIHPKEGGLLLIAGLYEDWNDPANGPVRTFTIVTRDAEEPIRAVHDRMPLLVRDDAVDAWIGPGTPDAAALAMPTEALDLRRVSKRVNSPRVDEPSLVEPIA